MLTSQWSGQTSSEGLSLDCTSLQLAAHSQTPFCPCVSSHRSGFFPQGTCSRRQVEAIREDSASWHLSPIWNEWTNAFSITLAPPIFVSRALEVLLTSTGSLCPVLWPSWPFYNMLDALSDVFPTRLYSFQNMLLMT